MSRAVSKHMMSKERSGAIVTVGSNAANTPENGNGCVRWHQKLQRQCL